MPGWMGPESRCGVVWVAWALGWGWGETALALLRVPDHGSSPGTMQKHAVVPPWLLSLGRGPPHVASVCSLSRGQMCQALCSGNPQYLMVTAAETSSPPHWHDHEARKREQVRSGSHRPSSSHRSPARALSLHGAGVSTSQH